MSILIQDAERQSEEPFDLIDEASRDSFPASDPPTWTPTSMLGPPARSTPPSRAEAGRPRQKKRDALDEALDALAAALADATPTVPEMSRRIADKLTTVIDALTRHAADVEGPKGLLTEIDTKRPTLLRGYEKLCAEHGDLLAQARKLRGELDSPAAHDSAVSPLVQQLAQFLETLRRHKDQEADLVYETVDTDLGAGD